MIVIKGLKYQLAFGIRMDGYAGSLSVASHHRDMTLVLVDFNFAFFARYQYQLGAG
jgi:hypothetical protein